MDIGRGKIWELDQHSNTIVAFNVLKVLPKASTLLAFALLFSCAYLYTPLDIVFNNICYMLDSFNCANRRSAKL